MGDNEPERIYRAACQLVGQGISVLPTGGGISLKAKQPHVQALKASGYTSTTEQGRVRGSWKPLQHELPTADDLKVWFLQIRAGGLGIVTGAMSGYVVIDVDRAGLPLMRELGWKPHVLSPSGGAHLYLQHPGWFVPSNASHTKCALPPGVDVRGDGGYIMFPPSRTRTGVYQRTDERRRLHVADVPERVRVAEKTYHLREALGLTRPIPQEPPSAKWPSVHSVDADDRCPLSVMLDRAADYALESRNKGAFMLGLWAHANGYSREDALSAAHEYTEMVRGVKPSPFGVEEAQTAITSAYTYPRKDSWKRQEQLCP
ncbi:bifunctional DNA primase/polymerase [Deinococcus oregonensis]|uniref:Bifunctional DNA primase/polymerase n=1 Tax=Deinococcus oregonensis TaxID=1805970 RepID=A0ABV6AZC5_9DEIO